MILCFKVGDNGDFVFHSGTAIDGVTNLAKHGSILAKIKQTHTSSGECLIKNVQFIPIHHNIAINNINALSSYYLG